MTGEPYPVLTEVGANEARELHCQLCDREHPVWFAPSDVWNAVMRRADGSDAFPFLCPLCFMKLAGPLGLAPTGWILLPFDDGPVNRAGQIVFVPDETL